MATIPSMADRDGFIWMDGNMVDWRDAKIHVLTIHCTMGWAYLRGSSLQNP